ncbi:MAG: 2-oxo acid dehydrogenase subunit E2 [Chloroflexota bacterium]
MALVDIVIDAVIAEEFGIENEFVVVTWLKREGDMVKKDDILVIIQADKVSVEIPSPLDGQLTAILVHQDGIATLGQPLGQLQTVAEESDSIPKEPEPEEQPVEQVVQKPKRDIRASPIAKRLARENNIDLAEIEGSGKGGRITEKDVQAAIDAQAAAVAAPPVAQRKPKRSVPASPIAKRLARESNIDLAEVEGSGKGGRITEKDVQAVIDAQAAAVAAATSSEGKVAASPVAKRMAEAHGVDLEEVAGAGERRIKQKDVAAHLEAQQSVASAASTTTSVEAEGQTIPLAGMRGTIAKRMHQSLQEMAQLTLQTEADVTDLVDLRQQLKKEHPITYTDLIMRACALALAQHPRVNARLDGDVIRLLPEINIGMAVALDAGLVVPVILQVEQKTLPILAHERNLIIARARANQLTAEDFTGGTFTVTNLGTYDIDGFTPIVNPPQIAILGVGRIVEKVVVHQGKVAQRSMMTLSLSFDHRLVDGAPAAAFLQTIKGFLEQPSELNAL